jgi:hypothetical protein
MLGPGEIARGLYGAWRLARLDVGGLSYFDLTIRGFWRSFLVAVLLAPFYAAIVALRHDPAAGEDLGVEIFASFIGYGLGWAAYPLAMVAVARALDLGRHYVPFIVAYNWSQAVIMAALLPLVVLGAVGALPASLADFLMFLVLIASLAYLWFIARMALRASAAVASAVVALEFLVTYLLQALVDRAL